MNAAPIPSVRNDHTQVKRGVPASYTGPVLAARVLCFGLSAVLLYVSRSMLRRHVDSAGTRDATLDLHPIVIEVRHSLGTSFSSVVACFSASPCLISFLLNYCQLTSVIA